MKPALATAVLSAAVLLAGCAGTTIGLHSSDSPALRGSAPAPGSAYSSAAVHAQIGSNAYFSLLFLGYFAAGVHDDSLNWSDAPAARKPPPLAEDRAIAERDCTLPMPQNGANLRCK